MVNKKHSKYDLEKKRAIFFQVGLLIGGVIVLIILEWSSPADNTAVSYRIDNIDMEMEFLPVKRQNELKPPQPRKFSKINVITDNNAVNDSFEFLSPEIEPKEAVKISEIKLKLEEEREIPTLLIAPTMPKFPGGKIGLQQYILKHLKYPSKAIERNIQGKVFVKFVVNHQGRVEQAQVVNSIHPLLDKEALRVINSLPKWEPATQNGRAVNVWMAIPIVFQI